ncbi:prepilin-type N-terminal cleavage/methylation domain-containing protein [Cellulomonas sp. URHB0016]
MIARVRKSMDEKDQGFTLIELLVVIIIIGILAAIAIPVFLNQRKKAVDASIKSDLRTVANELETYYTDAQKYPAATELTQAGGAGGKVTVGTGGNQVSMSSGNVIKYGINGTGDAFCVYGENSKGTGGTGKGYQYVSNAGGLQSTAVSGTCAVS